MNLIVAMVRDLARLGEGALEYGTALWVLWRYLKTRYFGDTLDMLECLMCGLH